MSVGSSSAALVEFKNPACYYTLEKYDQQRVLPGQNQPPSIKEQKEKVTKELLEKTMGKDEVWCLVEKRWLDQWKQYVQFENAEATEPGGEVPGPIDNDVLLENAEEFRAAVSSPEIPLIKLKKELQEKVQYEMVPSECWEFLLNWYGGGHMGFAPTVARHTYKKSLTSDNYFLDVRPFFVQCAYFEKGDKDYKFKEFRFCKFIQFRDMRSVLMRHWDINPRLSSCRVADTRLWVAFLGNPWETIPNEGIELQAYEKGMEKLEIILEPRFLTEKYKLDFLSGEQRKRSFQHSTYGYSSGGSYGYSYGYGYSSKKYDEKYYRTNSGDSEAGTPGACGLSNLGNTCYMNSAIQCLTKIPTIREYFISGHYKKDINEDNPLGYKGEVARAFGEMMELMWSGKHSKISPRGFKHTIGKFREAFSGYGQQDSHEVISFLLDSVHEDLNRIKKKPYTESVEPGGRPDHVIAKENWNMYKMRNDSVIVDTFQGQLKSEVQCPKCLGISIKFDPFTYLSVPVPGVAMRFVNVTVVFKDKAPTVFRVEVKKMGLIFNLRENLAEMCGIPAQRLTICEIFHHKVYMVYSDNDRVGRIKDHETIAAFELSGDLVREEKDLKHGSYMRGLSPFGEFQVVQKEMREVSYYTYFGQRKEVEEYTKEISPWPFMLYVPNESVNGKQVYDRCMNVILKYLTDEGKEELKKKGVDVDTKDLGEIFPKASTKDHESFAQIKVDIAERKEKERIEKEKKKKEEEEKRKQREKAMKEKREGKVTTEKPKEEEEEPKMAPRPPTPPKDDGPPKERPPTPPKDAAGGGPGKDGEKEEGEGHAGLPKTDRKKMSFQEQQKQKHSGGHSSSSSSKKEEEPKIVDPEREELDKRPVFFILKQYPTGLNYHSSTRNKRARPLYYTEDQLVNVPPNPEKSKYASSYYTYYSASRDKYHIKFEIILPEGFEKFLDMKKMSDVEKDESCEKKEEKKKEKEKVLTLNKCIEKFTEKEVLTKQNTFYCSRCKDHVEATKKIDIWACPEVLIIQLKRFQNSEFSSYRTKIEKFIDYPIELDMSPYINSQDSKFKKYNLFGVSNHYGGLGGGHYTASANAPKKGEDKDGKYEWYDFNDSFVKSSSAKSAVSSAGYVLFYVAQDSVMKKYEKYEEPKTEEETKKEDEKGDEKKEDEKGDEKKEDDEKKEGDAAATDAVDAAADDTDASKKDDEGVKKE